MHRRRCLRSVAAAGAVGAAGCLDTLPVGDRRTVLEAPDIDLSDAAHPSHGDDVPSVTLPDPLLGEEISTDGFEGDRTLLMTFIYTNCPDGMCPALTLRLRRAQTVAAEGGYGDEAAFLATTFDPERDTAETLREYGHEQGVDLDAGNWHFLRPERYEAGAELIEESFGLPIEKVETERFEGLEYGFPHYNLILLVNRDGVVERAYPNGATVDVGTVVSDFETVVKG